MDGWKHEEPLAPHTTFNIGGPAEYFSSVTSEDELVERIKEANDRGLPITVLGGGSNVLIADEGIRGAVIKIALDGIEETDEGNTVHLAVGAGTVFDDVVAHTVARGYWGIENLSYIPGSMGATPIQNVGAYGVEIGERIESVRVYDTETASFASLPADACRFGYRDSIFKHPEGARYIVTGVTLRLSRTPARRITYRDLAARFGETEPTQQEIRDVLSSVRAEKFPDWRQIGTAGSFFKNPVITQAQYASLLVRYPDLPSFSVDEAHVKVPLGWVLDKIVGVRGTRDGSVGAYEGQALVIVNYGGATARDVEAFARRIETDVRALTGIAIEREVTRLPQR